MKTMIAMAVLMLTVSVAEADCQRRGPLRRSVAKVVTRGPVAPAPVQFAPATLAPMAQPSPVKPAAKLEAKVTAPPPAPSPIPPSTGKSVTTSTVTSATSSVSTSTTTQRGGPIRRLFSRFK